jgi:hypothetical protein
MISLEKADHHPAVHSFPSCHVKNRRTKTKSDQVRKVYCLMGIRMRTHLTPKIVDKEVSIIVIKINNVKY